MSRRNRKHRKSRGQPHRPNAATSATALVSTGHQPDRTCTELAAPPLQPRKHWLSKLTRKTNALLAFSITVLGAVASYYKLVLSVRVECGEIDASDPYTTNFVIENTGVLPIYDLKVGCSYLTIDYETNVALHGNPHLMNTRAENHLDKLSAHQPRSFRCPRALSMNRGIYLLRIRHMELWITAKFKGVGIPWHQSVVSKFETDISQGRLMRWNPLRIGSRKTESLFPWPRQEIEFVVSDEQQLAGSRP